MFNRTARNAGFSLVEVLLVIVIILMLAGALVVYVLPQQEGAQINTTKLKLNSIESSALRGRCEETGRWWLKPRSALLRTD